MAPRVARPDVTELTFCLLILCRALDNAVGSEAILE